MIIKKTIKSVSRKFKNPKLIISDISFSKNSNPTGENQKGTA